MYVTVSLGTVPGDRALKGLPTFLEEDETEKDNRRIKLAALG